MKLSGSGGWHGKSDGHSRFRSEGAGAEPPRVHAVVRTAGTQPYRSRDEANKSRIGKNGDDARRTPNEWLIASLSSVNGLD
jgi:hypothetical protein